MIEKNGQVTPDGSPCDRECGNKAETMVEKDGQVLALCSTCAQEVRENDKEASLHPNT